jgi:tRNA(fMet)-specific endonuclease VapC
MVIFDTNILIEIYRGNEFIQSTVELIIDDTIYISAITAAEFLVGAKDSKDFIRLEKDLEDYTQIPLSPEITGIFLDLFKKYTLSRRPDIADTLIAATALYYDLPLYTLNKKHFQFIPGLRLY